MSTPQETLAGVLEAVKALFSDGTTEVVRKKANQWLLNFKKEKKAWSVANTMLSTPGLSDNAYYFAAYTLRRKIQYDFADLQDQADRFKLRNAVFEHAKRHPAKTIRMQLALAVSGLAILMVGTDWPTALADIVKAFKTGETAFLLLDILTVLPEECDNNKFAARRSVRERAADVFARDTENVLKILTTYMKSAGSNSALQRMVFKCFLSWVRYGEITPEALVNDPLFQYTFQAVRQEELFEISVEVLSELVLHTEEMKKYSAAVRVLVPHILSLSGKYDQALAEDDSESCKALTRLFSETGERYMPMVLEGRDEAVKLVTMLLKCTSHPDKDVASIPFNFWYNLSREVTHQRNQKVRPMFEKPFLMLIPRLKGIMEYPPKVKQFNDAKEIGDYKRYRYLAADVLVDTVGVIGIGTVLKNLRIAIEKEWTEYQRDRSRWHGVEACLYCFRSVARRVSPDENEVLPEIMKFLPQVSDNSALRYTGTLIVGRFNDWINRHPQFIAPLMQFVVAGLENEVPLVVSSAAFAFNYVCLGCADHLAGNFLKALFDVYSKSERLRLPERKEIVEGLANVVARLPLENKKYLQGLTEIMTPLAKVLRAGVESKESLSEDKRDKVCQSLDLIAQAFMILPEKGAAQASEILLKLRPILDGTMDKHLKDDQIMEKVCRCWKYGIRASRLYFKPMIIPLLTKLSKLFPKYPHSAFLYIVCVCVNEFGTHPDYQNLLAQAYTMFSKHGMVKLSGPRAFQEHPDVVGDFFDMQKRYIKNCPNIVFGSELIVDVFKCALSGIGVEHKDACSMLMKFFATFITVGCSATSRLPNGEQAVALMKKIMAQFGPDLTRGVIEGIAFRLPFSRIQFCVEVIESLIRHCGSAAQVWFQKALSAIPQTEHPITHQQFLIALFKNTSQEHKSLRSIKETIKEFASAVRAKIH
eukprot:CAMPEP_0184479356 /NCGR_PEP_ID=MMETSP0113_2-20130426/1114_1 /TAXON_ID=91329 /ORGANISM="Norrisiella sphaerica, Strain BC52" /LENGTH=929 /DNA_ID=CAMNT_0026857419 /DNA_START=97 /DNA_END=2886 /DNA_ORIENTATION=-